MTNLTPTSNSFADLECSDCVFVGSNSVEVTPDNVGEEFTTVASVKAKVRSCVACSKKLRGS